MDTRTLLSAAAAAVVSSSLVLTAAAAPATLFGDATHVDGAMQLRSDDDPGFGGVDIDVAEGITFADLTELSNDFNVTDDDCRAGSPRFQINVDTDNDGDTDGNIFVYEGPSPAFSGCPQDTWMSTGNLIGDNDPCRYDTSQLITGTQCNTYAGTLAALGTATVTGIQLVVDSGFAFPDGEQTVLIDNIRVNEQTIAGQPTTKDECKNGGYTNFVAPSFKNQGQCVSSVASKNK